MSDDHGASEQETEREETETTEGEGAETEVEETETEVAGEAEELAEGESGDGESSEDEQQGARRARGTPDSSQRDRRRTREEEFQREVDRAVERRLGTQRPQQPDFAEQRRQFDARRKNELDEARLQGPEAYADTRDRHLREDFDARTQSFAARQADERNQDKFDRLCERNTVYESVRDAVERRVEQLRGQGLFPDRQVVANAILGERYAQRAAKQGGQQRRNADRETRRQSVRAPNNPAGHQPASRRRGNVSFADKSVEEMERDLANIPIRQS